MCQAPSVDLDQRSEAVAALTALLRRSVQECGYNLDALAAAMQKDRSYIGRVLNGEKPLHAEFEVALPEDVRRLFARLRAEAHGYIVVEQVDEASARQQLASALFHFLAPALPAHVGASLKVDLRRGERRKTG